MLPTPGALFDGRYEIVAALPDQGLGEAWHARDTKVRRRDVAVKLLRGPGDEAFAVHARRLRGLRHAALLAVLDHGVVDGVPYVVHDFFDGASLATVLAAASLPPAQLARILERAAAGIAFLHASSPAFAHGALHPASVLVRHANTAGLDVRVTDVGVAAWSDTAGRALAPERSLPSVDVRTDVFGLGVVARALLGEGPGSRHRRADVPREAWEVALRAMHPDPEARFDGVAVFGEVLAAAWLREATPLTPDERSQTPSVDLGVPAPTRVRVVPPAPRRWDVPAATAARLVEPAGTLFDAPPTTVVAAPWTGESAHPAAVPAPAPAPPAASVERARPSAPRPSPSRAKQLRIVALTAAVVAVACLALAALAWAVLLR